MADEKLAVVELPVGATGPDAIQVRDTVRSINGRNVVENQEWDAKSDRQKIDWLRERLQKIEAEQVKLAEAVELDVRRLKRAARAH